MRGTLLAPVDYKRLETIHYSMDLRLRVYWPGIDTRCREILYSNIVKLLKM